MRPELSKVIGSCIKTVAMQFGLSRDEALEHFEDFISLERGSFDEMSVEIKNRRLLVHGDDTICSCEKHGVSVRFGDLTNFGQAALLNGLDTEDECILSDTRAARAIQEICQAEGE